MAWNSTGEQAARQEEKAESDGMNNNRGYAGRCVHTGASTPDLAVLFCPTQRRNWIQIIFTVSLYSKLLSTWSRKSRSIYWELSYKQKGPKDDLHTVYPGEKRKGEGNVASSVTGGAIADGHPDDSEDVCERGSFDSCLLEITAAFQGKQAKGRRGHGLSRVEMRMRASRAAGSDLKA